ncbi:MAG: RNA polymerase sigma-70 factor ECF subfamily [Chloroflexi bacterium]|nr:MAG: RNA polymerase sigma-70 factor ECF subfamily [Chloroflexota bacterium]
MVYLNDHVRSTRETPFLIFALMTITSDQKELDGLKQLNAQVISAIFDKYFPMVFRFVRSRVANEGQAEDITSDVFVRLLEAVRSGRSPETNIIAWLLTTASHATTDHWRQQYRHPDELLSESLPEMREDNEQTIEQRERIEKVQQAVNKLTTEQQQVISLRFTLGHSLEETAAQTGKNINAVKQLQFRALTTLNRLIAEVDDDR